MSTQFSQSVKISRQWIPGSSPRPEDGRCDCQCFKIEDVVRGSGLVWMAEASFSVGVVKPRPVRDVSGK